MYFYYSNTSFTFPHSTDSPINTNLIKSIKFIQESYPPGNFLQTTRLEDLILMPFQRKRGTYIKDPQAIVSIIGSPQLLKITQSIRKPPALFKMAQSFLLCLILAEVFLALAIASENTNTRHILHSNPPALSPSVSLDSYKAEAPSIRKLGKHQPAAAFNPSESPQLSNETNHSSEQTTSNEQEIHLKKNHHSIDRSVAGGGVILGGLATTFLVAVFCYIRATGRRKADSQITV